MRKRSSPTCTQCYKVCTEEATAWQAKQAQISSGSGSRAMPLSPGRGRWWWHWAVSRLEPQRTPGVSPGSVAAKSPRLPETTSRAVCAPSSQRDNSGQVQSIFWNVHLSDPEKDVQNDKKKGTPGRGKLLSQASLWPRPQCARLITTREESWQRVKGW